MSVEFFKVPHYCDGCLLDECVEKGTLKRPAERNHVFYESDLTDMSNGVDYLIILDNAERFETVTKLKKEIILQGLKNFIILPAMGCQVFDSPTLSKNINKIYNYCKVLDVKKYNPKVVLTLGLGMFKFTAPSVFSSWYDFRENIFNETYFYPHIKSEWKGRIYPCPPIEYIFGGKSFESIFFRKNLQFAKSYVENYESEKFVISKYEIIEVDDVLKFIEDHKNEKIGVFDTETNNLNVFVDNFKVGYVQISFDGKIAYFLPFDKIPIKEFSEWLQGIFQIYVNGKYDCKAFKRVGITGCHVDEDISLAFHLLNTERKHNNLKTLTWYIGFGGYEDPLDEYVSKNKITNYLDIPKSILMPYAGLDVITPFKLYEFLHKYLVPRQYEVYKLYREEVLPVISVFQEIEEEGMLVDQKYLEDYHNFLITKKTNIENKIYELAGKKFNIASNDELGKVLEELKLPSLGKTKKGTYQTGEKLLVKWEKMGFPIAKALVEYRQMSKLDNTYVGEDSDDNDDDIDEDIDNDLDFFNLGSVEQSQKKTKGLYKYLMSDGRIHGSIMPAMADTWRGRSSQPNIQNMLKHGDEGKTFRKIFIAPEDFYFCEPDYSGFQLRLMGIFSGDENLIDAFVKHGDPHSVTGCEIFSQGTSLEYFMEHKKEEPYKSRRFNGKTVNLAFVFSQSPFSFQEKLKAEWTDKQIDEYIEKNKLELLIDSINGLENKYLTVATDIHVKFFKKYPKLKSYAEDVKAFAKKHGYFDCPIFPGLRRHVPELLGDDSDLKGVRRKRRIKKENQIVNAGAQGGEAVIIYRALRKISKAIKEKNLKSRIIGCVHDSILIYLHKSEISIMYPILKEAMEILNEYSIPIKIDIEYGDIWGFGEDIDEEIIQGLNI